MIEQQVPTRQKANPKQGEDESSPRNDDRQSESACLLVRMVMRKKEKSNLAADEHGACISKAA